MTIGSVDLAAIQQTLDEMQAVAQSPAPAVGGSGSFAATLAEATSALGTDGPPGDETLFGQESAGSSGLTGTTGADGELALMAMLLAAPGGGGGSAPLGSMPASGAETGQAVVRAASQLQGTPYVWGGTSPQGFDCSGFTQYVYGEVGVQLPRTSEQQATIGSPVSSLSAAQPGDLVFFAGSDGTASAPGHVGIYVGDGEMIDAPHTGSAVGVQPVSSAGPVVAIRRVLPAVGSGGSAEAGGVVMGNVTVPAQYAPTISQAAAAHGIPASLLAALVWHESRFEPTVVSSAGAEGIAQFMPATAAGMGINPDDPTEAINGAARLLGSYTAQFGSYADALAAYDAGASAVERYGGIPPYAETQAYVPAVLSLAGLSGDGGGTRVTTAPASVLPAADVAPVAAPAGGASHAETTDTATAGGAATPSFTDVLAAHGRGSGHGEGRRDGDARGKAAGPEERRHPGADTGPPAAPADAVGTPGDAVRPVPATAAADPPWLGRAHDAPAGTSPAAAGTPAVGERTVTADLTPSATPDTAVSTAPAAPPERAPAAPDGAPPPSPDDHTPSHVVPAAASPLDCPPSVPEPTTALNDAPRPDPGRGGAPVAPWVVATPEAGSSPVARDQPVPLPADRPAPPAAHPLLESSPTPHEPVPVVAPVGRAGAPPGVAPADQPSGSLDVGTLAASISRPLRDGNGAYTVTVAMHPSDLGHLRAVMSLEGNDLQVVITPDTRTGHDALTSAAEALRHQLASAGLNVNVTLRDPGSSPGGDDSGDGEATSGRPAGSFDPDQIRPSTPEQLSGQIHLVL